MGLGDVSRDQPVEAGGLEKSNPAPDGDSLRWGKITELKGLR